MNTWLCDGCGRRMAHTGKESYGVEEQRLRKENERLRKGLEEVKGLSGAHFGTCIFCSKSHGAQTPGPGSCPVGRALWALETQSESTEDPK